MSKGRINAFVCAGGVRPSKEESQDGKQESGRSPDEADEMRSLAMAREEGRWMRRGRQRHEASRREMAKKIHHKGKMS